MEACKAACEQQTPQKTLQDTAPDCENLGGPGCSDLFPAFPMATLSFHSVLSDTHDECVALPPGGLLLQHRPHTCRRLSLNKAPLPGCRSVGELVWGRCAQVSRMTSQRSEALFGRFVVKLPTVCSAPFADTAPLAPRVAVGLVSYLQKEAGGPRRATLLSWPDETTVLIATKLMRKRHCLAHFPAAALKIQTVQCTRNPQISFCRDLSANLALQVGCVNCTPSTKNTNMTCQKKSGSAGGFLLKHHSTSSTAQQNRSRCTWRQEKPETLNLPRSGTCWEHSISSA